MLTTSDSTPQQTTPKNHTHDVVDMRPTRFDLTSGFFLTLILFLGVIVSLMFLLWTVNRWASQSEIRHSPPVRTVFVDAGDAGDAGDFDVPSDYEAQELTSLSIQESLVAVTASADQTAAALDQLGEFPLRHSRPGYTLPSEVPVEGDDIIPRHQRWRLNFVAPDPASYAAQLDYYHVELGVVGGGIQGVDIVDRLSTHPRSHRVIDTSKENRLYFTWTMANRLRSYEQAILEQADVTVENREVVRFISAELENKLSQTELEFSTAAGHPSVTEIAKTVFQSVADGDGFTFKVVDQRYR